MSEFTFYPEGMLMNTPENKEYLSTIAGIERAMIHGRICEARAVLCDSNHNLTVELGPIKGIIPREEAAIGIADGSVRDIAIITRVNKPVCFKISKLMREATGGFVAILSRAEAQLECMEYYIKNLECGDIIDARVTHLEPFGCFVDIGCGLISMIAIDNISISRISHPRDRFYPGQYIKAVVREIDNLTGRVTLSHKELLGTWEENASLFAPGQTAAGIVRSVEEYGVFIELTPNLAGLAEYKEGVQTGQQAAVFIKSVISEKMKIKLIIVDSFSAEYCQPRNNYFLTSGHIDRWIYSPECCERIIETRFDGTLSQPHKNNPSIAVSA